MRVSPRSIDYWLAIGGVTGGATGFFSSYQEQKRNKRSVSYRTISVASRTVVGTFLGAIGGPITPIVIGVNYCK